MFIKCVYYYLLYLLTFSYVKRPAPVSKKNSACIEALFG
ncbi:hypothetical protein GTCCBUS3UF5_6190 [Geobacillus thermoleovorans CCB_US3_UF5]|uniref:Uncharacterized protein n=3 Tax=Geobacillus TaxID=129337 RepID=A0A7U9J962_GEOTM|nr:hypothetical protein GTCCBUS3UF5_6190 [Geobacillus thermoleovorans CCB_US3_UF5]EQB94213.1 hypothetical protein GA8_18250 [Geobacillus sp. A8]ESU71183.1 hypothetical protein T260_15250 [Geobacillus sp. MAS1]GAD14780.1 hypothetical protein GBL_2997 [Geobacillus kaustophilus GBlys]GAJ60160.1 hypothetical protein B23_3386 [Geobacillus thermoleovorans B23]